jgi:hypothetical protein
VEVVAVVMVFQPQQVMEATEVIPAAVEAVGVLLQLDKHLALAATVAMATSELLRFSEVNHAKAIST